MPYVVCPDCGLRTYCVREDHCPRCDAALRAGAIGFPPEASADGSILPALALARRELAMDAAFVTEISSTTETVRWALANGWPAELRTGTAWRLEDTICRRLLDGEIDGAVGDVLSEPALRDIPGLRESGLGAYLGVALPTDRARLYVLCCLARERRPELGRAELNVLRGLGETVRAALAAHTGTDDRRLSSTP
jgi:GAF domain-containing protein